MVGRLCAEAEARGLGPYTLDTNVMGELADACPRTGTSYMDRELAMATQGSGDAAARRQRQGAGSVAPGTGRRT